MFMIFFQRLSKRELVRSRMTNSVSVAFLISIHRIWGYLDVRKNIAHILNAVWDNPTHREALNREAE
jgi:hypothetical protein